MKKTRLAIGLGGNRHTAIDWLGQERVAIMGDAAFFLCDPVLLEN